MTYYTLNSGHAMTRKDVRIHRGTKLVYFALCYSHQLWFNPGSNKTCTNKVIIPKELKNLRILIDRKDAIIEGGLRELVGTTAEQSPWARMYYSYLTERGFTDKEYEQWFPGDSKIPYDWFIPVDFSSYDMHTDKIIDVMCEWGDDSTAQKFCPDNMNLVVVEVRQVKVYRERENTPWMSKVVV